MEKNKTTPETEKVSGLTEAQLTAKESELNQKEQQLTAKESELNAKEVKLTEREANLSGETKEATIVPGLKFKFRGEDYKFTDSAPKLILFNGMKYAQKELVEDEDAIAQLIGGNLSLIQKL